MKDKATKEPFEPSLGVAMAVHNKGKPLSHQEFVSVSKLTSIVGMEEPYSISLYPGSGTVDGKRGDHILICPAYTVTKADVENIVSLAAQTIEAVFAEME